MREKLEAVAMFVIGFGAMAALVGIAADIVGRIWPSQDIEEEEL